MARPSRIAIVKELGSRSPRCLAAHAARGTEEPELVVVERYPASLGEAALAMLEDDHKALAAFDHPNAATVIATVKLKGDVAVLSEWVDGESLEEVVRAGAPFEVVLRALSDSLEALDELRMFDGGRVCGALAWDDVFVGVDGVTRITRFGLGRLAADALGPRRMATMAPEFKRGARDARCDVFTAGALAWSCFAKRPYEASVALDPSERDAWAAPLVPVIARALAEDPAARHATVGELARALHDAAPSHVASRATVSQFVARTFGERIEARLLKLEPKADLSLSTLPPPVSVMPPAVAPVRAPDAAPPDKPSMPEKTPEPPREAAKPAQAKEASPIAAAKTPEAAPAKRAELAKASRGHEPPKPAKAAEPAAALKKTTKDLAAAAPFRKTAPSAPDAGAHKAVPLPKRAPSAPDSAPKLGPAAPKVANGGLAKASAPIVKRAESAERPLPGVLVGPSPSEPKLPRAESARDDKPPPLSEREELDVDVDVVSVKPPPIEIDVELASVPPPAAPPAPLPEPAPAPEPALAPAKRSVRPAPAPDARKPKSTRPPAAPASPQPSAEDDVVYAKRSPYRGPLLVLGALVLAGASFALGRYTAPEGWPPPMPPVTATPPTATPSSGLPATTAPATATASATASASATATASATASASATATATASSTAAAHSAPATTSAPSSRSTDYAPSGI